MIQLENAVKRFGKVILDELKEKDIKCWLCGGCIRDYFMGLEVKTDYDLFFPNETEFNKALEYYRTAGASIKKENALQTKLFYSGKTIDLIRRYFASPQESIDNFDFTVSQFAIDYEKVYYGETSFMDLAKKQLMFNKITYPANTLRRVLRYYQKGFKMCMGEMKKLFEACQDAPKAVVPAIAAYGNTPQNTNSEDQGDFYEDDVFNGLD